jgi:hypothetical protein
MVSRKQARPRRPLRRILVLGGAVSGISALRALLLARNEKRYDYLIPGRSTDRS